MADWADEIAERLNPYFRNPDFPFEGIAAALRKAAEDNYRRGKADGMREASELFNRMRLQIDRQKALKERGEWIEKGTPND